MELLDVYNEKGKTTGKIVERGTKDESFLPGEHIAIAQIYIENDKGEFLFEKNNKKIGFPYVPVGGHVTKGETPKDAIIREVKEEIGLDISNEDIIDLGFFLVDFPVRFLFYIKKNTNKKDLKLQGSEVKDIIYLTREDILTGIEYGLIKKVHSETFNRVIKFIDNK